MTRHGKNSTAGSVYTYHERKKDTEQSGWGSSKARLGKDSIQEFDCCCLSLQPCQNAVITPDGFLYDKQCILENIIHQKREFARKLKEFEKQKKKIEKEGVDATIADQEAKLKKFIAKEGSIAAKASTSAASTSKGLSNIDGARAKELPSFWIPSLTPKASKTKVKKPDEKIRCPMSGKSLKMKHLIDVHFTPINDRSTKSVIVKDARYVCPVTNDVLSNSVPVAVLKTSGSVVTLECIEKIIRKDMIDPTNGKTLTDKDIIPLQRGSSGFAAAGVELEAKIPGPALMA